MHTSRVSRSLAALTFAVIGWSWLHSHMLGDIAPPTAPRASKPPTQPLVEATSAKQVPAAATRTIAGRALDTHGRPMAGANVWLTRQDDAAIDLSEPAVIAQALTRMDGRFELAAPVAELQRAVHNPLGVEVWIGKSGFALAHRCYLGEPPEQPLVIRLVAEPHFAIRVLKPDGTPCVGATVAPAAFGVPADRFVLPQEIRSWLRRPVGADGRVDVSRWASRNADVVIESPDFGTQTASLFLGEGSCELVTLRSTRTMEGRLVLPKGIEADLSSLRLVLLQASRGGDSTSRSTGGAEQHASQPFVFWNDRYVARPDHEGHFAFPKLPDARQGTLRLHLTGLSALGLADDRDSQCDLADLPAEKLLKIELPLRKGVWGTWIAREAHSKRPVAGVHVSLTTSDDFRCSGTTDEKGSLRVCLSPGETYRLECRLPDGYLRTLFGPDAYVEIPRGSTAPELPPIELVRGCSLEGQTLDAAGRSLAGVRVKATWQTCETKAGKKSANVTQRVTSDAAGHFCFEQVEAGAAVRLVAARAGVSLAEPIDAVAGDGHPVCLREQKRDLVALAGRIVAADHHAVPGASIVIEVADSPDPLGAFRTTVQSDGWFSTPRQFPPGLKYRVTVRSLLTDVKSSAWLCPAVSGNRFADLAVDSAASLTSKLTGKEVVARIDGEPIYAQTLLERAYTERLNAAGQSLQAVSKDLASGPLVEADYRSLQETAIKKYLSEYIGTRITAQAFQAKLDATQLSRAEESVSTEFRNYLPKLKSDLNVKTLHEFDLMLGEQGTSLASLKAEFRYRLFSNQYVRDFLPQKVSIVRPELLEYYRSHPDSFATPERVAWQLIEVNVCKPRPETTSTDSAQAEEPDYRDRKRDLELTLVNYQSPLSTPRPRDPSAASPKHSSAGPPKDSLLKTSALNVATNSESVGRPSHSVQESDDRVRKQKALETLNQALAQLRKGESFETVAKEFSDGSAAEQGGWQRLTRPSSIADATTAAALSRLAEGQTSAVIETDHSLRIVRVVARVPASTRPFEKVEDSIREILGCERQQRAFDDLCSRATIESAFPMDSTATVPALHPAAPTFPDDSTP